MLSTVSQAGLMLLWIGLGWFELAAWHLVLHAMWRAYQFLNAPSMMHMVNRAARPVPAWLARLRWLHTAALQRFWLDPLANWLLVRPTISLSRDVQDFDDEVVSRVVGLPAQARAISSVQHWEARKQKKPVLKTTSVKPGACLGISWNLRHLCCTGLKTAWF
jgi:NADH:ubiquinone oxidoreductase subunit 5 (subunit L)/multisubunit Na+/H+ antiporter MnhA subunit